MRLMEKIWDWLTTTTTNAPKKGHPDLFPLDVAKLTKELDLVEEAKQLGKVGLPAHDAIALTGPEALIVQRIEKARQDYTDWAVLRMQVLSHDLASRNVTQSVNRARQADKEFEVKASAILSGKENWLRSMCETALKQSAELEEFKVRNALTRDAHPPICSTFLRYMLLVAGILVEGLLNAHFFAQGLTTGLIGGFKFAAILAGLNIAVAFGMGKVWIRNVYHSNLLRQIGGVIAILFAVTMMVALALGISHMRDALTAEAVDAPMTALKTLQTAPFGLRDMMSWVLFGISLVFASLALLDGLFSDDLYPGYGAISTRTKEAIEDYENELEGLRAELEELKDDQLTTLDNEVNASQASVAVFESLIHDKRGAKARLLHALRDVDNAMEALLRKFRTENERHRGAVPRPAYFDAKPDLKPLPLPNFDTSVDMAALQEQRELVNALLAELQSLRARIQASFNRQFDQLKPLDTHFRVTRESNGTA